MRSLKDNKQYIFITTFLHPFIAMVCPCIFILTNCFILNLLLGGALKISPVHLIILFAVALESVIVGNILLKERIEFIHRLREPVFLLLLYLLFAYLVEPGDLNSRFISLVRVDIVVVAIIILLQWFLTQKIHNNFKSRELLLKAMKNYSEEKLIQLLRSNPELSKQAINKLTVIKNTIILFQIITIMILCFLFSHSLKPDPATTALIILQALISLFFIININNSIEDHLLYPEGISTPVKYQKKRITHAVIILAIVFGMGALLSSENSFLSLTYLQELFQWSPDPIEWPFKSEENYQRIIPHFPYMPDMGPERYWIAEIIGKIFQLILLFIKYLFLILVTFIVLYYLFAPFFSKYFHFRLKLLRPVKIVLECLSALYRYLIKIINQFFYWLRTPFKSYKRVNIKYSKKNIDHRKKDKQKNRFLKRLEHNRVIKAFIKLTDWGKKRGIPYYLKTAPLEYADELSKTTQDNSSFIFEAMEILDESLFSSRLIKNKKMRRYYWLIDKITKI